MPEPKPVLGYWNVRGLGAQLRYLLKYCNVDFTEELFDQTFDDDATGYDRWNRDEWMKRKFELGLAFPNLPFFIDGDVRLVQASAIQRYICHKWKPDLLGHTPVEAGHAAMIEGQLSDLNGALDKIAFSPDGTQDALKECTKTRLEPVYEFLVYAITRAYMAPLKGSKPFLVGDHVTFVDFILFEMLEKSQHEHIWNGEFFAMFPAFGTYHTRMLALPGMMTPAQLVAQGYFNGWRAKLGGAGEEMYKKYKQIS